MNERRAADKERGPDQPEDEAPGIAADALPGGNRDSRPSVDMTVE